MKTLIQYLDDAKTITGSDYKTSQAMGITRQHLSAWRCGNPISDDMAYKLGQVLGVSALEIIANQNAERTKDNKMRKVWEMLARSVAASLLVVVGLVAPVPDADAAQGVDNQLNIRVDIMRMFRWLARELAGLFMPLRLA